MAQKRTEKQYENDIKKRMRSVGTYRDEFLPTIERLAVLYRQRDALEKKYADSGGDPVIQHTNKVGATNQVKNPILTARDEIYSQLLSHERELGLTPSALKKLNGAAFSAERKTGGVRSMLLDFDETRS